MDDAMIGTQAVGKNVGLKKVFKDFLCLDQLFKNCLVLSEMQFVS